jgi:hypothetical protein
MQSRIIIRWRKCTTFGLPYFASIPRKISSVTYTGLLHTNPNDMHEAQKINSRPYGVPDIIPIYIMDNRTLSTEYSILMPPIAGNRKAIQFRPLLQNTPLTKKPRVYAGQRVQKVGWESRYQLNDRHGRSVAGALAEANYAGVPTVAAIKLHADF